MNEADFVIAVDPSLDEILNDRQWGQLTVWYADDGGVGYQALVRPGLDPQGLETFTRWAINAIEQFRDQGDPAAKGWNRSGHGEGYWYMTAAAYEFPPLDPFV